MRLRVQTHDPDVRDLAAYAITRKALGKHRENHKTTALIAAAGRYRGPLAVDDDDAPGPVVNDWDTNKLQITTWSVFVHQHWQGSVVRNNTQLSDDYHALTEA